MKNFFVFIAILAGLTACGGNDDLVAQEQEGIEAVGGVYATRAMEIERQCDAPISFEEGMWYSVVTQDVNEEGNLPKFTVELASPYGASWFDWVSSSFNVANSNMFAIDAEIQTVEPQASRFAFQGQFVDFDDDGTIGYMQGLFGYWYPKEYCMSDNGAPGWIVLALAGPRDLDDETIDSASQSMTSADLLTPEGLEGFKQKFLGVHRE